MGMFLKRAYHFVKDNPDKWITIQAYFYTAYYRYCIKHKDNAQIETLMGIRGEESPLEVDIKQLKMAKRIGTCVERVAAHTPWESLCLVRAYTARKLLEQRKIPATLYLGVGKQDGKMVAHAWLRVGKLYVTGGNGAGYACVAKFRTR